MRTNLLAFFLVSLSLVACGGGGDGGDGNVDPVVDARPGGGDAGGGGGPDAAPAACTATESFGDKGALSGQAFFSPDNGVDQVDMGATDDVIDFLALLETTQPADGIELQLFAGFGAFAGGPIRTGTFQLTGDELDYATCGVCVLMATDVTEAGYADDYMAISGTVEITAVGTAVGQTVSGRLTNVQFRHVDIGEGGATTPAGDSCASSLMNATFSAPLMQPMRPR